MLGMRRRGVASSTAALAVGLLVLLLLGVATSSSALVVGVHAGEVFSITEVVPPGKVVMFVFQMHPDFIMDVRIRDGDSAAELQRWSDNAQGYVNLPATNERRSMVFEFDNSQSMMSSKSINFDLRMTTDTSQVIHSDQIDPIEKKVQQLYYKMQTLRGLQEALRYQQKDHRATVEDVNDRVLWWSMMQVVGFLVAAGGHLWLLRRFLEKRRTI
ncbi:emp24/gp25L/p24 family/GOLD [Novymonas esmeraldas]|uniref:Emp24/gp25L/p24 family/GOLD n=1 Tax=Novymonas esmeraldas TaxID=1808958 RepID=A0AAW0FA60_9TRYP